MSSRYITPLVGIAAVLGLGCPSQPPAPAVPDAATAGLDAAVAVAPVDAGPEPLPGATLTASWDGGTLDLASAPDASISPAALLRFATSAPLADLRVRVLDDQDRMQPNRATISRLDGGTVVSLQPTQPWSARQCCRFAVDGERQPLPEDAAGHAFLPFQARFRVLAPPVPAAVLRAHHRRRHRRR